MILFSRENEIRKPRSDQTGGASKEKEHELELSKISIDAADNQAAFNISVTDLSDLLCVSMRLNGSNQLRLDRRHGK